MKSLLPAGTCARIGIVFSLCVKYRSKTLFLSLILWLFASFSLTADVSVAVFEGAAPVAYMDEDGNPAGIYLRVLEEIFRQQGESVRFVSGLSFKEAYQRVLTGEIDLMPALIRTPERQELFEFNEEVFLVSWSLLFIHPDHSVENILDLKNRKIALMEGGQNGKNFVQLMNSFDIPFQAVYFRNFDVMAEAVLAGEVAGMVSFSNHALSEERLKASSIMFSPTQSYIAVRKGGPVHLLDSIDKALKEMKQDDASVYAGELRILAGNEAVEVVPFWLIPALVSAGLIIFVVSLFLLILQYKIKQISARLQESEAGYKRLFHAAPDLISVIGYSDDKTWRFMDVNHAFCEKTGFSAEELLKMDVEEFISSEYKKAFQNGKDLLDDEEISLVETEIPLKQGGTLPIQVSSRIFEQKGNRYILSMSRDLSEREQLNSALSAIEQKYSTIADYNYDWEFWINDEGEFIYNSPSCERISGYTPDEFQQDSTLLGRIIHPDDRGVWEKNFSSCSLQDSTGEKELELRLIKKDGSVVWIHQQCRRILDTDSRSLGIRGNFRDVTEQKRMKERLAQKQKLSSLGVLAGGIAHDFNNILAIIKGFSEMGKTKDNLDEDTVSLFDTINQASIRGAHLTEQILDFSMNKIAGSKPVQVSSIIREVAALMEASLSDTVKVVPNIENNSFIMADEGQVHRVIMNLCTNARMAMPDGGELRLSVRELDESVIQRKLSGFDGRRCMEVLVHDTGAGMSDEVKMRAFDPYFTTRKTGEGSGMGLAVVHGLVQQWGGRISIESSPGKGTDVFLYLPILDYEIQLEAQTEPPEISSKPSKLLVVDDEPMILKLLKVSLEKEGYTVSGFSSAREALEAFSSDPDSYSLAVFDMTMPELKGDKLAELVKEINPDLPVILCSGSTDQLHDKGKSRVVDAVLNKPFTRLEILEKVSGLL
ncbi:MAG: PAS domain S-box protein [Spirochaetales bacterium]|nr:PAS domain S-box protein [Spirochaetales bacterium]